MADFVANNRRLAPPDLAILRRTSIYYLACGILRPVNLGLVLVRHEDDGRRAVRERSDLWRSRIMTPRGRVHIMPPAPSNSIIVRKQCLDIECAVARRLKDHHQCVPTLILGLSDTRHAVPQAFGLPVQTLRRCPGRAMVKRGREHGALVVVCEFLRKDQLHLAAAASPHKGLPDTIRWTLFRGLRSKSPRPSTICRPADRDAEMRGAMRSTVMVAEGRQNNRGRRFEQEHVVNIPLTTTDLAQLRKRATFIGASGNHQDTGFTLELGVGGEDGTIGQARQARICASTTGRYKTLVLVNRPGSASWSA